MGKDSPPPPDYKGAAEATGASNQEATTTQTYANRPNVTTPWGKQTWQQGQTTDPTTGKPVTSWSSDIQLSPDQQSALDSQTAIQKGRSGAAQDLLGQATSQFQTPIDYSKLDSRAPSFDFGSIPQTQKSVGGNSADYRQKAQDAVDQLQQPNLDRARSAEETRLSNQGIAPGSEAYTAAMRDVSDNETRAHLSAIDSGRAESAMMFGQDISGAQLNNTGIASDISNRANAGSFNNNNRSAEIAEEAQRRGMSLNELNALLTGQQVDMPTMPGAPAASKASGTDYLGAVSNQYGAQVDASNASNASTGSTIGQVAGLAAMAMMYY